MSRLIAENDGGDNDEGVESHSVLAVQAGRAATLFVAVAFLIPLPTNLAPETKITPQLVDVGEIGELFSEVLPYLFVPLLLSSAVGTLISLLQSKLKNRWWSEVRLGYQRERPGGLAEMFLVFLSATIVGLWSLMYWIGAVSGCLGIAGTPPDLLVALRGWLLSLGVGCAFVSVGALVLVRRPWQKGGRD